MAVVRQSYKQALREIWGAVGGRIITAENDNNSPRPLRTWPPGGVSSLSASVGATLRTLLRRYVPQPSEARGDGGREVGGADRVGGACLVHYCKLPGGAIMSSPLEGPAFRLRQEEDGNIVDDKESTIQEAGGDDTQQVFTVHCTSVVVL